MKRRFQRGQTAHRFRRQSHWAVMLGTALAASTTTGVQPATAAEPGKRARGLRRLPRRLPIRAGWSSRSRSAHWTARSRNPNASPASRSDGRIPRIGTGAVVRRRRHADPRSRDGRDAGGHRGARDIRARRRPSRHSRRLGIRRRRGTAAEGEVPKYSQRCATPADRRRHSSAVYQEQNADIAPRGASEYARHHHEHRRRRQRRHVLRRQRADPRVQRAQRHLRRRRSRCRADQPRRLQHRSRGSGEGPLVGHDRPRLDRRIDQSRQQDAAAQDFTSIRLGGGSADYKRTTLDVNQRLNNSVAFRFNGDVAGHRLCRTAMSRSTRAGASRRRSCSAWASRLSSR